MNEEDKAPDLPELLSEALDRIRDEYPASASLTSGVHCPEHIALVKYVDGDFSDAVGQHIESCDHCQRVVAALRRTDESADLLGMSVNESGESFSKEMFELKLAQLSAATKYAESDMAAAKLAKASKRYVVHTKKAIDYVIRKKLSAKAPPERDRLAIELRNEIFLSREDSRTIVSTVMAIPDEDLSDGGYARVLDSFAEIIAINEQQYCEKNKACMQASTSACKP